MDIFQLVLGIVFLCIGGILFNEKNKNKRFFGLAFIIAGIALILGGLGIKNGI